jgi:hypothetical protein
VLRFRSRGLILLAGAALILAGVLCLGLSGAVFTGWWQGTLDAFGVGFTVAGVVDVLAIFALNQSVAAEDRQTEENNQRARKILHPESEQEVKQQRSGAMNLLIDSRGLLDPELTNRLADIAFGHIPNDREREALLQVVRGRRRRKTSLP